MKGYCGVQDVRWALAPLDQLDNPATAARLTDEQLEDAIAEAEGIVDSFISQRYTITTEEYTTEPDEGDPVTYNRSPVPLWASTRDIAAFLAALTANKGKNMEPDDPIRLRYGVAIGLLTSIRDGVADLPSDLFPPVAADAASGIEVVNQYEPAMFRPSDVGLRYTGSGTQVYIPAQRW